MLSKLAKVEEKGEKDHRGLQKSRDLRKSTRMVNKVTSPGPAVCCSQLSVSASGSQGLIMATKRSEARL